MSLKGHSKVVKNSNWVLPLKMPLQRMFDLFPNLMLILSNFVQRLFGLFSNLPIELFSRSPLVSLSVFCTCVPWCGELLSYMHDHKIVVSKFVVHEMLSAHSVCNWFTINFKNDIIYPNAEMIPTHHCKQCYFLCFLRWKISLIALCSGSNKIPTRVPDASWNTKEPVSWNKTASILHFIKEAAGGVHVLSAQMKMILYNEFVSNHTGAGVPN